MIIGGHIVTRSDGGPFYGFGQTIAVYQTADVAAGVAEAFNERSVGKQLGPLSTAAVELRILGQRPGRLKA